MTAKEILARLGGDIIIDPFEEKQLNPNSYNLRLGPYLAVYKEKTLDMKREHRIETIEIPKEGLVIQPGRIYLGQTWEYTETHNLVPMLEGRSSIGRLGLFVHITAGFGDIGFCGNWTLEIFTVQPIRIYPYIEICQIFYHTVEASAIDPRWTYKGKYQNARGIEASKLYTELRDEKHD